MNKRVQALMIGVGQGTGLVAILQGLGEVYRPLEKLAAGAALVTLGVLLERKAR